MQFKVLIDAQFLTINSRPELSPIDRKWVLTFLNDFEDGQWRTRKFQSFIWDNIVETALSFRERQALIDQPHTALVEAAQKLRLTDNENDIGRGSELAEIVLYGIMKSHYGALPVVPKIYYKQNVNDNAKGADSVHIVINGDDFSLWLGEAKFYTSIEDARLGEIIRSVQNSLATDKLKKENSIITDVSDLTELIPDVELLKKIKEALSTKESIDNIKPKLHVPILLLHECELTRNCKIMTDEYLNDIVVLHKARAQSYFEKQIAKLSASLHLYSDITFHVILFPVPSKKEIVDGFISIANTYRGT